MRQSLIAIDGICGSGKTTKARRIYNELKRQGTPTALIGMDMYKRPRSKTDPSGLKMRGDMVTEAVKIHLNGGGTIITPVYNPRTGQYDTYSSKFLIPSCEEGVLIVEGITVIDYVLEEATRNRFGINHALLDAVPINPDLALRRRVQRDVNEKGLQKNYAYNRALGNHTDVQLLHQDTLRGPFRNRILKLIS